jgi:hypothetical protein
MPLARRRFVQLKDEGSGGKLPTPTGRGLKDILVAVIDGLKGFTEAILRSLSGL